jgi:hypothetical protein
MDPASLTLKTRLATDIYSTGRLRIQTKSNPHAKMHIGCVRHKITEAKYGLV